MTEASVSAEPTPAHYDAAKTGRVPSVRIGGPNGPVRFVREDLDRWLAQERAAWTPGRPRQSPTL